MQFEEFFRALDKGSRSQYDPSPAMMGYYDGSEFKTIKRIIKWIVGLFKRKHSDEV